MSLPQKSSLKRRKLRKGTFSCWECKHRKTRCEFKPALSVCVSCQRRGLSCISQEFETDSSNDQVEKRIDHVEELVSQLMVQRNGPYASIQDEAMLIMVPNPSSGCSVSSYLHSILPSPTIATTILERGDFLRLPMRAMWPGKEQLVQASERPSPSAHPVQFARKLMYLALCLQQLNDPRYNAARYIEIVSRHVTSQDMLVDSLDGVETLMLEATYHINNGNLRAAWLTFRRALAIAQLIGLDRMEGQDRANLTWFRLIYGDRFISLSLGLQFAVEDNNFGDLGGDARLELERIHVVVLGRIIARNLRMQRLHEHEYNETQDIDYSLKQATRSFPTSWWMFRSLNSLAEADVMERTSKLTSQMHHYYFLVILHQPYLIMGLRSPAIGEHISYSKSAIPPASREVLLRFLVLRSFHRGASYRGVDDKAFTAAIALLISHIDGHRLGQANVLEHQRPGDLGMIQDVLDLMEDITLLSTMVHDLKKLVQIEFESANGADYGWTEEGGVGLELKIPYFGTICAVLTNPQSEVSQQEKSLLSPSSSLLSMPFGLMDMIGEIPSINQGPDADMWEMET